MTNVDLQAKIEVKNLDLFDEEKLTVGPYIIDVLTVFKICLAIFQDFRTPISLFSTLAWTASA